MHWADWLLIIVGGVAMLLAVVAAAAMIEWPTGMMYAIRMR